MRAKRTLREARVPFEMPDGVGRAARMGSVLEVIHLIFNEGYAATSGDPLDADRAMRRGHAARARSSRHSCRTTPRSTGSSPSWSSRRRAPARVDDTGEPVLLLHQNRGRWDQLLIHRGLAGLATAERLGGALGPYALEAAIAACHARARVPEDTDWDRIAALYDALSRVAPSPVVEVNRAIALGMAFGPSTGLELADELMAVPELQAYYPLPSVRGELVERLGRHAEAQEEFLRAASLTRNAREQAVLRDRAARCAEAIAAVEG